MIELAEPNWNEYFISINAIISNYRGLVLGIYTTNRPDVCKFIAEDGRADIIVVENQKQLEKILQVSRQPLSLYLYLILNIMC